MRPEAFPDTIDAKEMSYRNIEAYINEITHDSKYIYEKDKSGTEGIRSSEGERFLLKQITDPADPFVEKIHGFMLEEFGEEETEALYWIRESIATKRNDFHIITDSQGEVISLSNTQYLEYSSDSDTASKSALVYVGHIMTDEAFRGKGLGKELYRSFLGSALLRARKDGTEFKAVLGEAIGPVEGFLNKIGRKRLYYEDTQGDLHELPYLCPPVDMDSVTGEKKHDPVPDHIMVRLADGAQEVNVRDVLEMLVSVYQEYVGRSSDYETTGAYEKSKQYIFGLLEELRQKLSSAKDGKLFMMSVQERQERQKELTAQGRRIFEVEI